MTTIEEIEGIYPLLKARAAGNPTAWEYARHIGSNIRFYHQAKSDEDRLALLAAMKTNLRWLERALKK